MISEEMKRNLYFYMETKKRQIKFIKYNRRKTD